MPNFPHLSLLQVLERKPFRPGTTRKTKGSQTRYNLEHRQEHYDALTGAVNSVRQQWEDNLNERRNAGMPDLLDGGTIPVYLKIDLGAKDLESLTSFGIQVISEEEDGFILGVSSDNFSQLTDRLDQFLNQSNRKFKDSAASLLEIVIDADERRKRILSPDLYARWNTLGDLAEMTIYVAVSCYLRTPDYPARNEDETDEHYAAKVSRWKNANNTYQLEKDQLALERESALENFVRGNQGQFLGSYISFDDGFGCMIRISGRGFLDLASNYPYIFNIDEHDELAAFESTNELEQLQDVDVLPPDSGAAVICVIDSGIQEGHRLLAPAIHAATSKSYVPGDPDTFDKVSGGGHGTRVSGAILYPNGFSEIPNPYRLPCGIQNARILNERNQLSSLLNEADTMSQIVNDLRPTRIFNLSVSNEKPKKYTHMPLWAASIDKLMWNNDVLFLVAAGNIPRISSNPDIPSIIDYMSNGLSYPDYLRQEKSSITNPAHSCFALTVGSIAHEQLEEDLLTSIADKDQPSSFSRSGLGLWGMIKPDVVEYGGDYAHSGAEIVTHENLCPPLVRSTRDGGAAVGRDAVGTSFSTPKVSYIVAVLATLFPNEPTLLYRALIAQSARLPEAASAVPEALRHYGYGLPDVNRATVNTARRITFYATGVVSPKHANLYHVKLPAELSRPGNEYNILIEISLSYKAEPRITRKGTRSYLSAWLDWEASKPGESLRHFRNRIIISAIAEDNETEDVVVPISNDIVYESGNFPWVISSRSNSGQFDAIRRQDGTLQKDWCTMPSNQMPRDFIIAVKGHKGWQRDLDKTVPYAIAVSFEVLDAEIPLYSMIEVENRIEIEQEIRTS